MSDSTKGLILAIVIVVALAFLLMLVVDWPEGESLDCTYHWEVGPYGKTLVCD